MKLCDIPAYIEDIDYVRSLDLSWKCLKDKSFLISGASGLIGSVIIDVLMRLNELDGLNCKVFAIGRNAERAFLRFKDYWDNESFSFLCTDVKEKLDNVVTCDLDYVVHLASNTHPVQYATDPIGTITTNVMGTFNLLDLAARRNAKRVVFASSNEIYGENRGDTEKFDEDYCGYINCNTLRAGYPESKRCGEALCQAFIKEKNLDIVIPRFTRSYGPSLQDEDTKAMSQFLHKGVCGEDIVLKSDGQQYFSYTYMADAVAGFFTILLKGETGRAYNIADEKSDIKLRDLAHIIAHYTGTKVVFDLPEQAENEGFSKVYKARLNANELNRLGWNARYDIKSGVFRTIDMLKLLRQ